MWDDVPLLEPLEQQTDARGNIRLRHNARTVRKLRAARHCLLEALLFATGEQVSERRVSSCPTSAHPTLITDRVLPVRGRPLAPST